MASRRVHTIQKDVTPEHEEEIRIANQSNEVSSWTIQELETCITKAEKDAGFDIRGNTLASEKMWAFVLFPETQERDQDQYPQNYEHDVIRIRKDRFINSCRTLLTRIESLEANKTPSKDINGDEFTLEFRVRRLIVDRKEMFEQYRIWERRHNRINNPTLAIDNTDTSLKDDEETTPYQKVLLFLLSRAYDEGYRRYKGQCCIQIRNTRAWRIVKEIKDYVYDVTQKEDEPVMWKNLTSRGNIVSDVVKHLTNCKDFQFPEIKKDRHVWSFQNGLLIGKDWDGEKYNIKFYDYNSHEFRELDPTIVSCKYFDLPFDPYDNVQDWWDIPTPNIQKVLEYQRLEEDVAVLSNNIEKKFGLSSIVNGFMFISPEVKGDLQLEQAEFQSMVSGEDVSVARKFDTALTLQWKTPGILGGNEVPNWKDNSGSILRRLITINFGRQIADSEADPLLEKKLETEIPAILCKCLRAYLDYANKYSDKDIWNVLPKYFKTIQSQVATVTNSLQHFLSSEKVRFGPNLFIPQRVFITHYYQHTSQNGLGEKPKFNQDSYAGPFSSREIEVRTDSKIYNGTAYPNQPFIFGVDMIPSEN